MAGSPQPNQELTTWVQIAEHIKTSVRQAQILEKTEGLPVRRQGSGKKPGVCALVEDLNKWKADRLARANESSAFTSLNHTPPKEQTINLPETYDPGATGGEAFAEPGALPTRRRWLHYGVLGISASAGLAGTAMVVPMLWRQLHQPATSCRIEGATLVVFGRDSVELWRHTFAEETNLDPTARWWRVFSDLDGDGKIEALFVYAPMRATESSLFCFEADGRLRWHFVPGKREVVDNLGRSFAPPYHVYTFGVVRSASLPSSRVVVSSIHQWSFADQVAVLDAKTGNVVSEYWHRGHLNYLAVADLNGDGEPEVLLGGVNDAPEYKQATVVVFDHRRISGASCDPKGKVYFQGMSPGTEKLVVFFPKTPISQQQEFNRVAEIRVNFGRIAVYVAEGTDSTNSPRVIYEFDYNFRPLTAQLVGNLQQRYMELQAAGKLPKESPYTTAERLLRQVKVIRSGKLI